MGSKQQAEMILNAIRQRKQELLISKFRYDKYAKNELIFFFKPECFLVDKPDYIEAVINMVFNKLKKFNTYISGILLLNGKRLDELLIMERHYGFINTLSKNASEIITDEELLKIRNSLGIDSVEKFKLLGGHEFIKEYNKFNENSLNELWLSKKSIKLRSGFYFQKYTVNGENVILINGFHPAQITHFTNPVHKIVLLLLHSDTDWKILKNDLAGDTFPENSNQDSIRGEIYTNSHKYSA
jgi:hypothetical protein